MRRWTPSWRGTSPCFPIPPQTNLQEKISKKAPGFSYQYLPFLGQSQSEALIPASCEFYLSAMADSIRNRKKTVARDFMDFFASEEAQFLLSRSELDDGGYSSFSHRKGSSFADSPDLAPLSSCLSKGRIFLIDLFVDAFSDCLDALSSLREDTTYAYGFVQNIDEQREAAVEFRKQEFDLTSVYASSGSSLNDRKECLDLLSASLRRLSSSDVLLLPPTFLESEILAPTLSELDLEAVFDPALDLIPCLMKGSLLQELLEASLVHRELGYSYAGVRRNGDRFLLSSGSSIRSDSEYLVYCPEELLALLSASPSSLGKPLNALSLLRNEWKKA